MIQEVRLPRLPQNVQIVTAEGLPTIQFSTWWDQVCSRVEALAAELNRVDGIVEP